MKLAISCCDSPILEPQPGCDWADTMVLNPAMIRDPKSSRLHMLFRASGPWSRKQYAGRPLPYPIFLGYAWSEDEGRTWSADFSRPALAPSLEDEAEKLYITNTCGERAINYANGCIEDPRLFWLEGELFLSTACRMFAPGPYWINDEPTQCAPGWIFADHQFGRAARENLTVSVLWKVNLQKLAKRDYENAFTYVTHLTDPEKGDNRDAFLFPEKLVINGRAQYVCVHRPMAPKEYGGTTRQPSIFLAAAESVDELASSRATHHQLATSIFGWEGNRVGGSFPPIRISANEWLLGYHGKQDGKVGYTQSFMILREQSRGFPVVTHRCSDRLMYAKQPWELAGRLATPCLFSCAGELINGRLLISYGAADTKVGIASVNFQELVEHVRNFDALGRTIATGRIEALAG